MKMGTVLNDASKVLDPPEVIEPTSSVAVTKDDPLLEGDITEGHHGDKLEDSTGGSEAAEASSIATGPLPLPADQEGLGQTNEVSVLMQPCCHGYLVCKECYVHACTHMYLYIHVCKTLGVWVKVNTTWCVQVVDSKNICFSTSLVVVQYL